MTSTQTPTTATTRQTLRQTDFLPSRFSGDRLDRDSSTAHFLTFDDYLDAHDIDTADPDQFPTILRTFRRTLQGQARLWIDGLTFNSYTDLKDGFVRRFSPAKSSYSHIRDFNTMTMTDGESAEAYLQRLRLTATYIDYGETQIKHRLLDSLPDDCRAAILLSAPTTDSLTNDEIAAKAQLFLDLKTTKTKELTFSAQSEIEDLREQITSLKMTNDDRGRDRHRRSPTPRRRNTERSTSRNRRQDQSRDKSYDRRGRSPYRNDDRRNRRPRLICDYCQIPGHVWRECRKRLRTATATRPPPPPPPPPHNSYGPYYPDQQYFHQQFPQQPPQATGPWYPPHYNQQHSQQFQHQQQSQDF